jgi:DNA repair protein RadC
MWNNTLLDARHRLIAVENLFRGSISSASVHPREVVKAVLARNAAAVVCRVRMRPRDRILP